MLLSGSEIRQVSLTGTVVTTMASVAGVPSIRVGMTSALVLGSSGRGWRLEREDRWGLFLGETRLQTLLSHGAGLLVVFGEDDEFLASETLISLSVSDES